MDARTQLEQCKPGSSLPACFACHVALSRWGHTPLVRLLQRVAWLVRQPGGERPAHGVVQEAVHLERHRNVEFLAPLHPPLAGQARGHATARSQHCRGTSASRVQPAPAPKGEGLDVDVRKPHLTGGEEWTSRSPDEAPEARSSCR